jgi:hypothetical protein
MLRSYLSAGLIPIRSIVHARLPRDGTATPPAPHNGGLTDEQIKAIIKREGKGNSYKAIRVLAGDAATARERARTAEEALKAAKKDGIAPDGSVIIKGDDAKALADVQKFMTEQKLDWKGLLENAKAAPELKAKVAKAEHAAVIAEAADDMEWDGETLIEVLQTKQLEIGKRNVRVTLDDGKKVVEERWHVRKAGDDKAEWEPLDEYAETNLKLFIPALEQGVGDEEEETAAATGSQDGASSRRQQRQGAPREEGTRFVPQTRSKPAPASAGKDDATLREEALKSGIYNTL